MLIALLAYVSVMVMRNCLSRFESHARTTVDRLFTFLKHSDFVGLENAQITTKENVELLRARDRSFGKVITYRIDHVYVQLTGTPWGVYVLTARRGKAYLELFGGGGDEITSIVDLQER